MDAKTIYWSNGWVRPDMTLLTTNGNTFAPQGFSNAGVPLYDFASPQKVSNWIALKNKQGSCGSPIIDNAGNISDGIAYHTVDGRKGTYPNPMAVTMLQQQNVGCSLRLSAPMVWLKMSPALAV